MIEVTKSPVSAASRVPYCIGLTGLMNVVDIADTGTGTDIYMYTKLTQ